MAQFELIIRDEEDAPLEGFEGSLAASIQFLFGIKRDYNLSSADVENVIIKLAAMSDIDIRSRVFELRSIGATVEVTAL